MTTRPDYKVRYRTEASIAAHAADARRKSGTEFLTDFNVRAFVDDLVGKTIGQEGRIFRVEFEDAESIGAPAEVIHHDDEIILSIDREIYDLAGIGEPKSRFILAHEIGHILLHDHHSMQFSEKSSLRKSNFPVEETSEWQANTFAEHFLVPTKLIAVYESAQELSQVCAIPLKLAGHIVFKYRNSLCRRLSGDFCFQCGSAEVVIDTTDFICLNCKTTWGR
jgi:hypothetical protein